MPDPPRIPTPEEFDSTRADADDAADPHVVDGEDKLEVPDSVLREKRRIFHRRRPIERSDDRR